MSVAALPCFAEDKAEKATEKPAAKSEATTETVEKVAAKPSDGATAKSATPLPGVTFVKPESKEGSQKADEPTEDELAVQAAIKGFADAFNAQDAKAVAAHFTDRAELENQVGHVTTGNPQILELFTKLFTDQPEVKIHLEIQSIRFLSSGLAIEEGFSTMTGMTHDKQPLAPHVDRYTITHVKQDGNWLVASARDWPPPPPTAAEQLQQLAWVDENSTSTVHTNYHWSKDGRYLMSRYSVQRPGKELVEGLQRIGWDPEARQLRSWTFDSIGGFSQALWSRNGDQWVMKTTGVMADGQIRSSTTILTRLSKDHAMYQSRDRVVGGEVQPDLEPIPIVRKAPEPMIVKPPVVKATEEKPAEEKPAEEKPADEKPKN
jgi:uncharacterized protein (TIGR02246 family)